MGTDAGIGQRFWRIGLGRFARSTGSACSVSEWRLGSNTVANCANAPASTNPIASFGMGCFASTGSASGSVRLGTRAECGKRSTTGCIAVECRAETRFDTRFGMVEPGFLGSACPVERRLGQDRVEQRGGLGAWRIRLRTGACSAPAFRADRIGGIGEFQSAPGGNTVRRCGQWHHAAAGTDAARRGRTGAPFGK